MLLKTRKQEDERFDYFGPTGEDTENSEPLASIWYAPPKPEVMQRIIAENRVGNDIYFTGIGYAIVDYATKFKGLETESGPLECDYRGKKLLKELDGAVPVISWLGQYAFTKAVERISLEDTHRKNLKSGPTGRPKVKKEPSQTAKNAD